MQIRRLTEQDIPDLLNAINDAFADYIVPFQLNTLKWHRRTYFWNGR